MGDEGADTLIEAGEDRCEDLVGDGCGVSSRLLISFGQQGRGLRSGKSPRRLGDVDAVAEDDRSREGGRGWGELGEDAADFA